MKILKIIGSIFLVLIALIVLLPFLFQGRIAEEVQKAMDENLNATVEVGDIGLSLISSFPDFSLSVSNIKITGKEPFAGVELVNIGNVETKLDLMSVVSGDKIEIKKLGISDASFHVWVNKDGLANYDIVKSTGEATEETEEVVEESGEESPFAMGIQELYLQNINVIYNDVPGNMMAEIVDLDFNASGDMTLDVYDFNTQTNIEALTFKMDGMRYLNKANLDVKFDVGVDMPNNKYTFRENHFGINDLMLHFDGFVAMPNEEAIDLDLTFGTEKTSFKSLLSLVPAIYMKDFESVQTTGNLALSGMAKGRYEGEKLPAFKLDLTVDNGTFQYPDLPKAGENIAIDLHLNNPGGDADLTVVDLKKFHIDLGGNPIDLKAYVSNPVSDANIDAELSAHINLETLADVIPAETGVEQKGLIDAEVKMKGAVSTLEAEDYENFDASGSMKLQGIAYTDTSLGYPVILNSATFNFSPRSIELAEFSCLLGSSDISGNGIVSNYLPYYFHEKTIAGNLALNSNFLDLNELAGMDEESTSEESAETNATPEDSIAEALEVIEVPANIDFVLKSKFDRLIYDNMAIRNMKGKITVRDQKVSMDNLSLHMLEGDMTMSGYYETTNPERPTVNFDMDIQKFDLAETYITFNTVDKMAPIGENATGRYSTTLKFVCALDSAMEPDLNSLTGGGTFRTKEVQIKSSPTLDRLAEITKNKKLKDPKFEDIDVKYEFKDGRMYVDPFDVVVADFKATISGSNGFDQTLDYDVKTKIPMEALGEANKAAQSLLAELNAKAGTNVSMGENIDVSIKITGTVDDPKIKPILGGTDGLGGGKAFDMAKEKAKEEIERLKKMAEDSLRREAERIKKQAEDAAKAEAERLKNEAESEAKAEVDRLKKEAEARAKAEQERLKKEAEKRAQEEKERLKKEAEDRLKGLFKK